MALLGMTLASHARKKLQWRAANRRYRIRLKASLAGDPLPPILIRKGVARKPLTQPRVKALSMCTSEERSRLLKLIRQREWAAKARKENPIKYLEQQRKSRKKYVELGAYKVGGSRYYGTRSSPKRRAYFKRYNATRRKELPLLRAFRKFSAKEVGL